MAASTGAACSRGCSKRSPERSPGCAGEFSVPPSPPEPARTIARARRSARGDVLPAPPSRERAIPANANIDRDLFSVRLGAPRLAKALPDLDF